MAPPQSRGSEMTHFHFSQSCDDAFICLNQTSHIYKSRLGLGESGAWLAFLPFFMTSCRINVSRDAVQKAAINKQTNKQTKCISNT